MLMYKILLTLADTYDAVRRECGLVVVHVNNVNAQGGGTR